MEEGDFTVCGFGYFESQELLMRRLLSLFRSSDSQSSCTDFDCVDPLRNLPQPTSSDSTTTMMLLMGWFAVALALYYLRPSSLRNNNSKSSDRSGPGFDGPPPGAPPAVN